MAGRPMYKAYRYKDTVFSTGDEEYGYRTHLNVTLIEFNVVKETPKGFWVEDIIGRRRFVNLHSQKKYACLSKSDAIESFIRRKQAQIRILKTQLRHAEEALRYGEMDKASLSQVVPER